MQQYFFPDQLTLTCPTCKERDVYRKGSNASFGPGVLVKSMGLVAAQCPRGHQFSLPEEEADKRG